MLERSSAFEGSDRSINESMAYTGFHISPATPDKGRLASARYAFSLMKSRLLMLSSAKDH